MPTFRPDLTDIPPYVPGRPIDDVATESGLPPEQVIKLASNECPDGPFPGVVEAATGSLAESHRYPDTDTVELVRALSAFLEVPEDHIWPGAGSVALLTHIALAVGGPGTSAVFAWPSFIMYRTVSEWAMTERIEVPLVGFRHDLSAMAEAVRADTTVVYVCNPNNPTGTIVDGPSLHDFVTAIPEGALIVVDEAYHDYVTDPSYASALSLALQRPNVVVLRTFSKVFGLASHRIGYAIATPATVAELRKTQPPFTVSQTAQIAAVASLGNRAELARRVAANEAGRHHLLGVLAERGVEHCPSQANFVYLRIGDDSTATADAFLGFGVIIRPMSAGWVRVTIGNDEENRRFVEALDQLLAS